MQPRIRPGSLSARAGGRLRHRRPAVSLFSLLILALGACDTAEPTAVDGDLSPESVHARAGAAGRGDSGLPMAALKRSTARFHSLVQAERAGYIPVSECVALPTGEAAMGIHFGRPDLLGDAILDPATPEALVYEPQPDGSLDLVAIEYIIPFPFHGPELAPPVLFGQAFSRNDVNGFWALHVWLYRDNPWGVFADFNPNVTCEHGSEDPGHH